MLMVSIVDNSEKDIAQLQAMLEDAFRHAGTVCAIRVYRSGIELVRSTDSCDILFMDIQMERLDGMETARILRKLGSEAQLIFTSRKVELAILGYEVDAIDFLMKPLTPAAVNAAVEKALKRLASRGGISLALKLPTGIVSVSSNDVAYVEVFDHNLIYHTVKGEYNIRGRLSDVSELLEREGFLVCSRSFLVNSRFLSGIGTDHVTVGDVRIPVSKSHRREILNRFSALQER